MDAGFGRFFILLGALFWLASGVYVTLNPNRFIHNTQFPWTKLPLWGARILGIALIAGGVVMIRAYILYKPT
jgi:hypothetical protein